MAIYRRFETDVHMYEIDLDANTAIKVDGCKLRDSDVGKEMLDSLASQVPEG